MSTYLELCNKVAVLLNEVELTAVASATGVQKTIKEGINMAIRDVINFELEWPFNHQTQSDTLTPGIGEYDLPSDFRTVDWDSFFVRPAELLTNVLFASDISSWTDVSGGTGSAAHTTDGNGRMRLTGDGTNAGAATQAISTHVGKTYLVVARHFNNAVTLKVGTTSGGEEILSQEFALNNAGIGEFGQKTFTATATTTYITFSTTSTTAADVDQLFCRRNETPRPLKWISYDEYRFDRTLTTKSADVWNKPDVFAIPRLVYEMNNDKYGVHPKPDEEWVVDYEYWNVPDDLSVDASTSVIPTRYENAIVAGARYYVLSLRSDPAFADRARKEWEQLVKRMRTELINTKDEMKSTRENVRSSPHPFFGAI